MADLSRILLLCVTVHLSFSVVAAQNVYQYQRPFIQQLNVETCAGAGYTGCCIRGNTNCFVPGGNCFCDITCHNFGDCCVDIEENGCSVSTTTTQEVTTIATTQQPITTTPPPPPPVILKGTCTSAGHNSGCCTVGGCFVQSGNCFCDADCHRNHNCCPDIDEIGCVPTTCAEASLNAGCCSWFMMSTCHVQGGQCYCDELCHTCGDCCSDVETNTQCGSQNGASWISKLQGLKATKNSARRRRNLNKDYMAGIIERSKMLLNQEANRKEQK